MITEIITATLASMIASIVSLKSLQEFFYKKKKEKSSYEIKLDDSIENNKKRKEQFEIILKKLQKLESENQILINNIDKDKLKVNISETQTNSNI